MKLKIVSESGRVPSYETKGSSGFDIPAYLPDGPVVLGPGERKLVPTGVYMEIPEGFEVQIRARSGLAIRNGIGLVNGIGTIDSDYRGEIRPPLINLGTEDFIIQDGDRICQAIVVKVEQVDIELADALTDTERGEGGFGHTGV